MPHRCLKCNTLYTDNSSVLLKGCSNCGNKFFLYLREVPKETDTDVNLNESERDEIIEHAKSLVHNDEFDKPVLLTLENIKILKKGKYEIDIGQLLQNEKPIVIKVGGWSIYAEFKSIRMKQTEKQILENQKKILEKNR